MFAIVAAAKWCCNALLKEVMLVPFPMPKTATLSSRVEVVTNPSKSSLAGRLVPLQG